MSLMGFDSRNFKIGISVDVVPWARMAKWMTLNTLYCGHKLYCKPAINSWWYVQILRILQMLQFKEKYIVRKNTKIWIISLQYWRSFINTWLFIVHLISEFTFRPKHIAEILWRGYDSCLRTWTLQFCDPSLIIIKKKLGGGFFSQGEKCNCHFYFYIYESNAGMLYFIHEK